MLNISSISGQASSVGWVLDKGVDVNQRSREGLQTALHAAAFSGQDKVLKLLLERGWNRHITDSHGFTPARLVEWAILIRIHKWSKNPARWSKISRMLDGDNAGNGNNVGAAGAGDVDAGDDDAAGAGLGPLGGLLDAFIGGLVGDNNIANALDADDVDVEGDEEEENADEGGEGVELEEVEPAVADQLAAEGLVGDEDHDEEYNLWQDLAMGTFPSESLSSLASEDGNEGVPATYAGEEEDFNGDDDSPGARRRLSLRDLANAR